MGELEISAREAKENKSVSIIALKGAVDGYTLPKFEEETNNLLNAKRYKLIIDCKDLNFISSAGVGVLIVLHSKLVSQNGDIKLVNMSPEVYEIFRLLGFSNVFRILNNEREALEEFERG